MLKKKIIYFFFLSLTHTYIYTRQHTVYSFTYTHTIHTYVHTDIYTCIHTYIQTDRQTGRHTYIQNITAFTQSKL